MNNIPVEILSKVLEYIPIFYSLKIRLVCKYFNNVFENYFLYDIKNRFKILVKIKNLYQNRSMYILKKIYIMEECKQCSKKVSFIELRKCDVYYCGNMICYECYLYAKDHSYKCKYCKRIHYFCRTCLGGFLNKKDPAALYLECNYCRHQRGGIKI